MALKFANNERIAPTRNALVLCDLDGVFWLPNMHRLGDLPEKRVPSNWRRSDDSENDYGDNFASHIGNGTTERGADTSITCGRFGYLQTAV